MSTHLMGPRPARVLPCPGWSGFLLLLFLQAACVAIDARPPDVGGQAVSSSVHLASPSRFGAVQVSRFELNEALASLVLHLPLRVAASFPPLYLHRMLAQASTPLMGEEWRTPLSRSYGRFCERSGTPGDCLGLFDDGPGLDGEDKRDLALALSVTTALDSLDGELRSMFSTTQLYTMVGVTLAAYMALLVAPEPVSKGVAAALALLMWGYLGWELFDLVQAYFRLWEEAAEAATFAELREAGDRFGEVIGPNSVRILLMLGTAAVGETAALVSKAPKLPGFAKATEALKSHAGINDVRSALLHADKVKVAVSEGTFSVVLPANVLSMASRDVRGGSVRGNTSVDAVGHTRPSMRPDPHAKPDGQSATPFPKDDEATRRSLMRENESANLLAQAGYRVEQRPFVPGASRRPDYRIEGQIFDNYAPSTSNPRSIWTVLNDSKVNPVGKPRQADRIVLNLRDSGVDLAALKKQFTDWVMPNLKEVLVITQEGRLVPFWP
ncbi:hypothetical protein MEBOL_003575 [Melittangium boletus DSM 14713]|uniref:tRNA nuclease CdiA C-terminal domain-containing protein n=1 Tax=Melittangium boletus DSM 14713 TaxID=1294270 RepID=A0A250IFX9_9BACT|nr:hypothetical protein MEBOL_003575 [Melittangium boletus DSM 14713]